MHGVSYARLRFFFICALLPFISLAQTGPEKLKQEIENKLADQRGVFAVAFKDLKTGETIFINEDISYHAASTMKTPVMVEVYWQARKGKLSLRDSLQLHDHFKSIVDSSDYSLDSVDDSEKDLYRHLGEKRAISQLVYPMITVSSNLCTNLVIEKVGARNVSATMVEMGLPGLKVLRGVEDDKAYQQDLINTVTAKDLMLLFEKIAKEKAVSRKASEEMISILLDQKFRDIIPARLPVGVKVAHKTGWFKTVHHDSGIVFLPDGRKYVLVLLGKEIQDEEGATAMLAGISEIIYHFVQP